jgi:ribosomal protein S18 acetylase RimI-like enzyme
MRRTDVLLRPISSDDKPVLYLVFASTRMQELTSLGWSAEQQMAFLTRQFDAQHQSFQASYPNADFQIILVNGGPAGRLYVARTPSEIRLIELALLPEYRRAGIGSDLIRALLDEATGSGRPVRLHIKKVDPALRLYQRLGFKPVEDNGIYWFIEWAPQADEPEQSGSSGAWG